MTVATAVVAGFSALTFIGIGVGMVNRSWFIAAVEEAGARSLGNPPTVETILATREAMRQAALEQGAARAVVFAAIVRRVDADGRPRHVAAFFLCAGTWRHPELERELPQLLSAAELERLHRERIREHTGDDRRWTHHHHR